MTPGSTGEFNAVVDGTGRGLQSLFDFSFGIVFDRYVVTMTAGMGAGVVREDVPSEFHEAGEAGHCKCLYLAIMPAKSHLPSLPLASRTSD